MRKGYYKFFVALWTCLLLMSLFNFTHKFVVISGDSMERTLLDGDIVLASTILSPVLGDCYMLKEPEGKYFVVKRLVGLPGDNVELKDGVLYRNGELLMGAIDDCWDNAIWNLDEDEYLFLGDNRAESYDGRHWPRPVHLDEILYHLDRIIYPLHRVGKIGGVTLD